VLPTVIYDEIFDEALQVLPEHFEACLKNAQHVARILYDKHVDRMLATHLQHPAE
jgi:hypothetical protein